MTTPYYADESVTLYHGDCREVAEWLAADVLVTDPPYGIGWKSGQMSLAKAPVIETVSGDGDTLTRDEALALWGKAGAAVIFGSWRQPRPPRANHRLIWHKLQAKPAMRTAAFYSAEEEIYLIASVWVGTPIQNVIVTNGHMTASYGLVAKTGHPTPKPVGLMETLIAKCPAGAIADPFAGSGSTLVAARNLGRKAIGVEIDERYCETAARRLSQGVLVA